MVDQNDQSKEHKTHIPTSPAEWEGTPRAPKSSPQVLEYNPRRGGFFSLASPFGKNQDGDQTSTCCSYLQGPKFGRLEFQRDRGSFECDPEMLLQNPGSNGDSRCTLLEKVKSIPYFRDVVSQVLKYSAYGPFP